MIAASCVVGAGRPNLLGGIIGTEVSGVNRARPGSPPAPAQLPIDPPCSVEARPAIPRRTAMRCRGLTSILPAAPGSGALGERELPRGRSPPEPSGSGRRSSRLAGSLTVRPRSTVPDPPIAPGAKFD